MSNNINGNPNNLLSAEDHKLLKKSSKKSLKFKQLYEDDEKPGWVGKYLKM